MSPPIFHRLSTRSLRGIDASETARRNEMVSRRTFLYGLGMAMSGGLLPVLSVHAEERWSEKLARDFAELEKERGGRLGVAVADTHSGKSVAYRGDERFPMCSTFKTLAVAAILARADAGKE